MSRKRGRRTEGHIQRCSDDHARRHENLLLPEEYIRRCAKSMPRRRRTHASPEADAHASSLTNVPETCGMADDVVIPCEFCDEPVWFSMYEGHASRCAIRHQLQIPSTQGQSSRFDVSLRFGQEHPRIIGISHDMLQLLNIAENRSVITDGQEVQDEDGHEHEAEETEEAGEDEGADEPSPRSFTLARVRGQGQRQQGRRAVVEAENADAGDEDEGRDGLVRRTGARVDTESDEEALAEEEAEAEASQRQFAQQRFISTSVGSSRLSHDAMTQLVDALTASFMMSMAVVPDREHEHEGGTAGTQDGARAETGAGSTNVYERNLLLSEIMGGSHRVGVSSLDAVTSIIQVGSIGCETEMCPICQDDMSSTTKARKTTCGHLFCHGCIGQWLKHSKKCPVCMADLET